MAEREGAKRIEAAARAVMADVAKADRDLLLCQGANGTHLARAELSRDGRVNLRRLLAAIENLDPNELSDLHE